MPRGSSGRRFAAPPPRLEPYPAAMPSLVLGPVLRYVGETDAVIWVETDAACEVEVLGTRERTFCVCDHHYALVCCGDLEPGAWHEYEVALDGERVWPVGDGFPASAFHTYPKDGELNVVFGSCRVAAPHVPPYSLAQGRGPARPRDRRPAHARAADAKPAARRVAGRPADDRRPGLRRRGVALHARPSSRRGATRPRTPGERVVDFEEYTHLYRRAGATPRFAGSCRPSRRR